MIMKKVTLLAATVVMAGSLFTACGKGSTPQYEATVDEVFTCGTYDGTALVVNLDATNNTDSYLATTQLHIVLWLHLMAQHLAHLI
jgi:hypothetical protein